MKEIELTSYYDEVKLRVKLSDIWKIESFMVGRDTEITNVTKKNGEFMQVIETIGEMYDLCKM